jgi:hypothetical protein
MSEELKQCDELALHAMKQNDFPTDKGYEQKLDA